MRRSCSHYHPRTPGHADAARQMLDPVQGSADVEALFNSNGSDSSPDGVLGAATGIPRGG